MMDWRPISSDGNGGTQPMNPLVDPKNWLVNIDPKHQETRDMGIYVNPAIAAQQQAQQQAMASQAMQQQAQQQAMQQQAMAQASAIQQQGMLSQSGMPTGTMSHNPYSLLG
jgi:predicted RNA-binding protein YlxR (DUF448 family)